MLSFFQDSVGGGNGVKVLHVCKEDQRSYKGGQSLVVTGLLGTSQEVPTMEPTL